MTSDLTLNRRGFIGLFAGSVAALSAGGAGISKMLGDGTTPPPPRKREEPGLFIASAMVMDKDAVMANVYLREEYEAECKRALLRSMKENGLRPVKGTFRVQWERALTHRADLMHCTMEAKR